MENTVANLGSFVVLAALLSACGGSPPELKDPNSIESIMSTPTASPSSSPEGVDVKESGGARLNDEQQKQMEIALRRGRDKAENCDQVTDNCPLGESEVQVVFDGQKGRVTDVLVTGPPFAGTVAEGCIKRSFIGEIIVPFDGDPINVPYTIKISKEKEKAPEKADKGKKKPK